MAICSVFAALPGAEARGGLAGGAGGAGAGGGTGGGYGYSAGRPAQNGTVAHALFDKDGRGKSSLPGIGCGLPSGLMCPGATASRGAAGSLPAALPPPLPVRRQGVAGGPGRMSLPPSSDVTLAVLRRGPCTAACVTGLAPMGGSMPLLQRAPGRLVRAACWLSPAGSAMLLRSAPPALPFRGEPCPVKPARSAAADRGLTCAPIWPTSSSHDGR